MKNFCHFSYVSLMDWGHFQCVLWNIEIDWSISIIRFSIFKSYENILTEIEDHITIWRPDIPETGFTVGNGYFEFSRMFCIKNAPSTFQSV